MDTGLCCCQVLLLPAVGVVTDWMLWMLCTKVVTDLMLLLLRPTAEAPSPWLR